MARRSAHPALTPQRPKRNASEAELGATPSSRARRTRDTAAPRYVEVSEEEEDVASLEPAKKKRKVKGEVVKVTTAAPPNITVEKNPLTKSPPKSKKNKKLKEAGLDVKPSVVKAEETVEPVLHTPKETKAKSVAATTKVNGQSSAHKSSAVKPADDSAKDTESKPKRRRKTKEEKEAEAMPIAARTLGSKLFIGAHVSAAGGVHNAVTNSVYIGGNAFALFQKSQRKWDNPSIKPEHAEQFKSLCAGHNYAATAHVVPHGSYLVNLAAKDAAKAQQAYDSFLDDVLRSESLGIKLYNFHPGNTNGEPREEAIGRIAERLNAAHKATGSVVTLLENMAASPAGNTIGSRFEDLRAVIDLIDDKSRVGVCLDTCHTFAAGYDLRSPEAFRDTMATFADVVGFKYLRAVHMNDSKAPLGAHRDLHQNIGCGFLGLRAFHNLVNDSRFEGFPLILETPIDRKDENGKAVEDKSVWAREIKLLESLVGMNADGDEFKDLERELADRGAVERAAYQEKYDKKLEKQDKENKKKGGAKGRGSRKKSESPSDSDDED